MVEHFSTGLLGYNQKEVDEWINSYKWDSLKIIDRLDADLRRAKAENEALRDQASSFASTGTRVDYEILGKARQQAEAAGEMLLEEARGRIAQIIEEGYKRADVHRSQALVIEGRKIILKKELFNLLETLRDHLGAWHDQPEATAFKEEIAGLTEDKVARLVEEQIAAAAAETEDASSELAAESAAADSAARGADSFDDCIDLQKAGALALYDQMTGAQVAVLAFLAMITALLVGNLVEGLGILAPLVLIVLFVCKELAAGAVSTSKNSSKIVMFSTVDRVLYLAILPLLIIFVIAVLYRIIGVLH
ncbi:DivIVA domain-containing protein [Pelotomaculum propionicicum]|uniref:Uncharacterized protein n=1 Tax=Pelotomaculum propionicicum TaxID=258475 RepID=A0A4Y7RPZ1_9FIRM|nr:hypothetical protein [Pelotomaculum propionicicum]TEB11065.1 hypothetical protein Pmgp_01937 [Pelotomaculum propionicicum]